MLLFPATCVLPEYPSCVLLRAFVNCCCIVIYMYEPCLSPLPAAWPGCSCVRAWHATGALCRGNNFKFFLGQIARVQL